MKPRENDTLFETPLTSLWFDEQGFLCSLSKKAERSIENYCHLVELYKSLTKERGKLCVISDTVNSEPMSKEVISYIALEFPKYLKAFAIISNIPIENSHVNTFLKLTFADVPVMMFSSENEAKRWLKDYL